MPLKNAQCSFTRPSSRSLSTSGYQAASTQSAPARGSLASSIDTKGSPSSSIYPRNQRPLPIRLFLTTKSSGLYRGFTILTHESPLDRALKTSASATKKRWNARACTWRVGCLDFRYTSDVGGQTARSPGGRSPRRTLGGTAGGAWTQPLGFRPPFTFVFQSLLGLQLPGNLLADRLEKRLPVTIRLASIGGAVYGEAPGVAHSFFAAGQTGAGFEVLQHIPECNVVAEVLGTLVSWLT